VRKLFTFRLGDHLRCIGELFQAGPDDVAGHRSAEEIALPLLAAVGGAVGRRNGDADRGADVDAVTVDLEGVAPRAGDVLRQDLGVVPNRPSW